MTLYNIYELMVLMLSLILTLNYIKSKQSCLNLDNTSVAMVILLYATLKF